MQYKSSEVTGGVCWEAIKDDDIVVTEEFKKELPAGQPCNQPVPIVLCPYPKSLATV